MHVILTPPLTKLGFLGQRRQRILRQKVVFITKREHAYNVCSSTSFFRPSLQTGPGLLGHSYVYEKDCSSLVL